MITINKTITETTTYDGAEWEVRYRRKNGIVESNVILDLFIGDELEKTIQQPLPAEIYEAWGEDDSVIQDWLFEQNDITLV
jgi:hypothetical protein